MFGVEGVVLTSNFKLNITVEPVLSAHAWGFCK